jgi:hypothetical protein
MYIHEIGKNPREILPNELAPLLNFSGLQYLIKEYPELQQIREKIPNGGLCWALGLTNAIGHINREQDTTELIKLYVETLLKLTEIASTDLISNKTFRISLLHGRAEQLLHDTKAGFRGSLIFPIPNPELNALFCEKLGIELKIPFELTSKEYPELMWETEEGKIYLMDILVGPKGRAGNHLTPFTRIDEKVVFYESQCEDLIILPITEILPGEALYSGLGIQYHFNESSVPLEVVTVPN